MDNPEKINQNVQLPGKQSKSKQSFLPKISAGRQIRSVTYDKRPNGPQKKPQEHDQFFKLLNESENPVEQIQVTDINISYTNPKLNNSNPKFNKKVAVSQNLDLHHQPKIIQKTSKILEKYDSKIQHTSIHSQQSLKLNLTTPVYTDRDASIHVKENIELAEKLFTDVGYNSNKTLKQFDCFQEQITPQQWVDKCKKIQGPHGSCPIYINKQYVWTPVWLISYDEQNERFIVRMKNGQHKEVIRLSLLFFSEDQEKFKERVETAKYLQNIAADELRFYKYVDQISNDYVCKMQDKQKEGIMEKLFVFKKNKVLPDKQSQNLRTKFIEKLTYQVENEYILFQKKGYVLNLMSDISLSDTWNKQRIKNRYMEKTYRYFGTIEQLNYPFEQVLDYMNNNVLTNKSLIMKTFLAIFQRHYTYNNFQLFNYKFEQSQLPMTLQMYEYKQKNFHFEAKKVLNIQWREFVINEIQDRLRDVYRFYQTEPAQYAGSELSRLLKLCDFYFNNFMREMVVKQTCLDYVQFFQNFTLPSESDYDNIWSINQKPLLQINLLVKTEVKQVKKIKDKKKKDGEEEKEASQTTNPLQQTMTFKNDTFMNFYNTVGGDEAVQQSQIYYEPSLQQVVQTVLGQFEKLIETTISYQTLEKDLVPLIDLGHKISYEIDINNEEIYKAAEKIMRYLEKGFEEPLRILQEFNKYNFLFEENINKMLKDLFGEGKSPNVLKVDSLQVMHKLDEYNQAKVEIIRLCNDDKDGCLFQIKTKQAKDSLMTRVNELINGILQKVSDICGDNSLRIADLYTEMAKKLQVFPKDEKQWVQLRNHVAENENNLIKIKQEVKAILRFLNIMENWSYDFPEAKANVYWELYSRPTEIVMAIGEANKNINSQEEKFQYNLDQEKLLFVQDIKKLYSEFNLVKQFNDYKNVRNNSASAIQLMEKIEKANDKLKNFNEREVIFKQNISEYDDLTKIIQYFSPYYQLWTIGMEFDLDVQDWMNGPFLKMQYTLIEKKVNQHYFKESVKLIKKFDEISDQNAGECANDMKAHIEKFILNLWIIELLTTEAMSNPRRSAPHWKELFKETQVPNIEPNDDMTLNILLTSGLTQHRATIEDISRKAEKQWGIEKKLKEMEEKIKCQNVELIPYKSSGTCVLKALDEVFQLLDDMLNVLMMMIASPYIKPLIKQAKTLEQKIILIQDTLEESLKCQRGWMYLEPIFASDDIKKKMPTEQKAFEKIDNYWRETMLIYEKDPCLWDVIDNERMKNEFITHNKSLDVIQKSLSEYLETKRRYFPRFYFLSDEELLEILADTKDPLKVQKHINKCFEAINQLDFADHQSVVGMISSEKENVKFIKKINVNEGDRKGNVEVWLLEIENTMIETLVKITAGCIQDLSTARTLWVQKWPGQIILSVNMQRWTQGVEVAIQNSRSGDKHYSDSFGNQFSDLTEYKQFLEAQLQDIVNLVRQELTRLVRMTLGALVVLDVHAKDTVLELERKQCMNMQDFLWTSQLRYYWEDNQKEKNMWVKMINAAIKYGFEYLGNSTRLVITPLTDRCYRTLMGANNLQYGGAPEGPAGTGKTETVKDLAKALAVYCNVFNCSDGLNYLAMRKFFKGLASSGAWCCFDEFNRIDLEVLSVIAQQVLSIYSAIKEKKRNFIFDDEEIALNLYCAINITMNPGYAGRSELPDNLKALFRPCAMMVPDYALIAEIFLYSVGFSDARNLARKIVASLRLSSEQLSSQDHYDFGMRALKAILTAAGDLKREMLLEVEDIVCLRAIMDVNLPKFTLNDVPLFLSITSDLFPRVKKPEIDYGKLEQSLKITCSEKQLQTKDVFLQKCIQLYDTIKVRHGLMMVGAAFSGKSSVLESLRYALSRLKGIENFTQCVTIKLNPKSVTSDQLYGKLDPDTKSWTDGVAAVVMRTAAQDCDNPEKKWIVFDGPVDAVWIENMNTVLDDNKKLCLTSGEIIKLSSQMTMMFEVEDLASASPATVSRCGMVFLETKSLGWFVLVQSYCQNLLPILHQYQNHMEKYLKWLIDNTLAWTEKHAKFQVHKSEMNLVCTLLKLVQSFLVDFEVEGAKVPKDFEEILNQILMFCTIWSIGAAIDETSRKGFSDFIIHLVTANPDIPKLYNTTLYIQYPFEPLAIIHKIPENSNVFEFKFNQKNGTWIKWTLTVEKYVIPKGGEFNQLIVPTIDSIRNNHFLHNCLKNKIHFLICGPTGTGKTANVISEINKFYFNAEYTNLCTSFSGQTKSNQVQRLLDAKMSTRRRKGYYGPEEGKRYIVIFVDDVNMPAKETYGAQPPIELLRQCIDQGGWYDLDTKEWKNLQDITFVIAMLPSGTKVTMRYLRYFQLLYVQPFESESLIRIFSNVMEWYFTNLQSQPSNAIKALQDSIVKSTIQLYNSIQNSKELLPTPAKSHYIYNLRDISKVFQGISKASIKSYNNENDFTKLWANECERVFKDRLINDEDQEIFSVMLKQIVLQNFKKNWDDLVTVQPLMWGSFVPCIYPDGDTTKKPLNDIYCEITDRVLLKKKVHEYLDEYNQFYSANRMNLVLFLSALSHIVKIFRIITTSLGHALLVGVGGSGRKSLATLSSFIAFQNETFQCDPKIWIEDLQKVMKSTGLDEKETVFMLSDTQISKESQLEDICMVLNKGEVPNLFPLEEKLKLLEEISFSGTPNEKFQYFVSLCKKNLHMVLTFSPVGEQFRRRLRTFPTLVNCTTIDWFLPWPQEALKSTASTHFISTMNIEQEEIRNSLVDICVDMQQEVRLLSQRYIDELRRYYYVTPTSYLELLATFHKLLFDRTSVVQRQIIRYETGVTKILDTEVVVEKMKIELEELQPVLVVMSKENAEMLVNLQIKQKEADEKRVICEADEKACSIIKDEANILRQDCQSELDKVVPLLQRAAEALNQITKDDMNTLKSFVNPPVSAAIVLEGLTYAFDEDKNVKWIPKPEGKPGEKIQDFWDYSKKKLLNDKLINRVKAFKENEIRSIPQKNVEKLQNFVKNPLFEKEKVFNASKAAGNLSLWVRAVCDTYGALLVVDPKKAQLQIAEAKLKEAEDTLGEKKRELQKVIDLLTALQNDYEKAKKQKEELEFKVNKCKVQLERAGKLISGLSGEKNSWSNKIVKLKSDSTCLIGDSLLSSGIIAYLGAFPIQYREFTIQKWKEKLQLLKIKYSQDFSLQNILSDQITIGQWTNSFKLPNDSFSIDNAIILKNSSRWPLMIDPQTQANIWVKKLEASRKIKVLRPTQSINELTLQLESSIQYGFPVLLENVTEEIDQLFEPILQKKLIKQGSSYKLKFAEGKFLDYSLDFSFYMTTKLPRPHYPPEICVKVTLLNFQVTSLGLEDQMTNIVVQIEEPIKDRQRQTNIEEFFNNKEKQRKTEELILQLLNEASGNLLDDEKLIQTLQTSKIEGNEIEEALKKQEHFQVMFDGIRKNYNPVAVRVSNLYFVILDLALIEPTYQWSLEFYINLFIKSIEKALKDKENRINNLIDKFQEMLYDCICRSLLEKDKLIFSLLICQKILELKKKINTSLIRFLMVGGSLTDAPKPIPQGGEWMSNKNWCSIIELSQTIPEFKGFLEDFEQYLNDWKELFILDSPLNSTFPGQWGQIQFYMKLIIIRILFPSKFSQGVTKLIEEEMGERYVSSPPFDLEYSIRDGTPFTPFIFILSPGADPRQEILNTADKLGKKSTFMQISLGQGQGAMAESSIKISVEEGRWVLLQNCHLAISFMPQLERILENMENNKDKVNGDFRIWLTSMPSENFPPVILMKGIKMTFEPPRGMKNNLLRVFSTQNKQDFNTCNKVYEWKKLFFGLAFFHGLILQRRQFGPLGWNIPYEFTMADFTISFSQLKQFLDDYEIIPWEALNYMVAEANYGGRVTDVKDRRLIKVILLDFYTEKVLDPNYKYSKSGIYYAPDEENLQNYIDAINVLPIRQETEIFGLHPNAEITSAIMETDTICNTVLSLLPKTAGGAGKTPDEIIKIKCKEILAKLPKSFDIDMVKKTHKVDYNESMNTVLQQELIRFNKLLNTIRNSVIDLGKAIDGLLTMTQDLEKVFISIFDNKQPELWIKVSYPSLKPLGSYLNNFIDRLNFMQKWITENSPPKYWISGFYFTQSFLTGTLQNFARKFGKPIDTLSYKFVVIDEQRDKYDFTKPPANGCYIYGLFMDGARWDANLKCISESIPKQLYTDIPLIWLCPTDEKINYDDDQTMYCCPTYKTTLRRGTLSTTGHSTNFVLDLYLPIHKETTSNYWVKMGVAAVTQLND